MWHGEEQNMHSASVSSLWPQKARVTRINRIDPQNVYCC